MRKLVYIAGPMRGIPDWNYPKFNRTAIFLRLHGYCVINPVEIGDYFGSPEYLEANPKLLGLAMDIELCCISRCDCIYLLDGWETSDGARKELETALRHGLKVLDERHAV